MTTTTAKLRGGIALAIFILVTSHTVFGANTTWIPGGDVTDVDNWFKSGNWNNGVPTSADTAFIIYHTSSGGSFTDSGSPPGPRIEATGAVADTIRLNNASLLRVLSGGDLTVGNFFSVGEQATFNNIGSYVYQSGGTVSANALYLGGIFASLPDIGIYNQSGGTLSVPNGFFIGFNGSSKGVFNLSGGTATANAGMVVGNGAAGSMATVVQDGGTLTTPYLQVFAVGGSSATYTFNGGALNLTGSTLFANGSAFTVGNGTSAATLTLSDGGTHGFFDGLVIANNATLKGTGTENQGAVTINNGGTLSPGLSPGTITVAAMMLSGASILSYELGPHNPDGSAIVGGGTNDLTVVNGNLTLDGILNVTALDGFGAFGSGLAATNVYRLFNYIGTLTDDGLTVGSMPVGTMGFIDTSVGGQVNLFVIPEPSFVFLVGLGGLLLWRRHNRTRRA